MTYVVKTKFIDKIRELINLRDFVKIILSNGTTSDYRIEYHLVFNDNVSVAIRECIEELNLELDYYDPDSSYGEDVFAFYNAVNDLVIELERKMKSFI